MGKHCCVYGCNGNSDNGLSMHSFPKNPKIRRLWISLLTVHVQSGLRGCMTTFVAGILHQMITPTLVLLQNVLPS